MENTKIIELVKKVAEERNEIAFSEIFDFIAPKILPRPHPISNISEFGFNFIFLNKNLLNDLM